MNSTIYYGNLNISKLAKAVKEKHPAVYKSEKTGDIYLNFNLFVSKQGADKSKNHGSICSSQNEQEKEKGFYFANFRLGNTKEVSDEDIKGIDEDLSF